MGPGKGTRIRWSKPGGTQRFWKHRERGCCKLNSAQRKSPGKTHLSCFSFLFFCSFIPPFLLPFFLPILLLFLLDSSSWSIAVEIRIWTSANHLMVSWDISYETCKNRESASNRAAGREYSEQSCSQTPGLSNWGFLNLQDPILFWWVEMESRAGSLCV